MSKREDLIRDWRRRTVRRIPMYEHWRQVAVDRGKADPDGWALRKIVGEEWASWWERNDESAPPTHDG